MVRSCDQWVWSGDSVEPRPVHIMMVLFFSPNPKMYDTVWWEGLWLKLWRKMYEASRSAVLLEGEKSAEFRVEQGGNRVVAYS